MILHSWGLNVAMGLHTNIHFLMKIKEYLVLHMPRTIEIIGTLENAVINTFPEGNASGLRIRSNDE